MAICADFYVPPGIDPPMAFLSPNGVPIASCSTYVLEAASDYQPYGLSYADAGSLVEAAMGLFALAFLFRLILNFILKR